MAKVDAYFSPSYTPDFCHPPFEVYKRYGSQALPLRILLNVEFIMKIIDLHRSFIQDTAMICRTNLQKIGLLRQSIQQSPLIQLEALLLLCAISALRGNERHHAKP